MTKKIYQNKNGNMSLENWIVLIHTGELDSWMRQHKVSTMPCPPYKLISSDTICFYCKTCFDQCERQVKEYKNHYQVGKDKFMKEDLVKGE